MSKTIAYLQNATNNKKFKVTILYPNGRKKTVQFGAKGYSDYTIHKDKERMKRYDSRHKPSKSTKKKSRKSTKKKSRKSTKKKSRKSTKKKSRKSTKKKSRK